MEMQRAQSQFRRLAQGRIDSLQADLELTVSKVADLGAFCESAGPITRSSFKAFAASVLATPESGLQALEWAPHVPLAQRAALEDSARRSGLAGFEIRDRAQGRMVRSGDRPSYFPVLFIEPEGGNELAVGYDDLDANPVRHEVLKRAASSRQMAASARITLVQETSNQYGIILARPVYDRHSRERRLLGFVEGVLRLGDVVQRHGDGSGIALAVMDLSAPSGEQQLYPAGTPLQSASEFSLNREIGLGGRKWRIVTYPSPGAFPVNTSYSYAGAALCLLFTLLAVSLLAEMSNRNLRVERLMEERTRELDTANTSHEAVTANLYSAMEQVRESIVITDPEGRIVYVNPAFELVSGYSREEAIGKRPNILKSGRHPSEFYGDLWQTLKACEPWRGRLINRAKDGHLFTEDANIAPVVNRSGQLINYVAVKRDVTLELELQERLQQSQKMDAIGRLAGGVAHDFNNMLMVIVSYAEMAQQSLEEDDPARTALAQVLRAANRSFALTRQLLAFSRKQVLAPQVLDCNAILTETSSMVRRLISENIELRCELANDLWPVKADPDQIVQVILNLCVNSRDAMPHGGTLVLTTRNYPVDEGFVVITVSDTGTGISPEVQKKLFEPFFTTKEKGKGTGLGLATVYGIVKQTGGHIRVKSSPGQGAIFSVYLPRCYEMAASPEPSVARATAAACGWILVAEDEETLREAMVDHLRNHGYHAVAAADGVEALELLHRTPQIGTVVCDLIMPRMGGCELARQAAERFPQLAFVYITGHGDQDLGSAAEEAAQGGRRASCLQKPFAMSALVAAIAELNGVPPHSRTRIPQTRLHSNGASPKTIH
jgi:PAS domain S-box-containing protein